MECRCLLSWAYGCDILAWHCPKRKMWWVDKAHSIQRKGFHEVANIERVRMDRARLGRERGEFGGDTRSHPSLARSVFGRVVAPSSEGLERATWYTLTWHVRRHSSKQKPTRPDAWQGKRDVRKRHVSRAVWNKTSSWYSLYYLAFAEGGPSLEMQRFFISKGGRGGVRVRVRVRWFSPLCTYWGQLYWHNTSLVSAYSGVHPKTTTSRHRDSSYCFSLFVLFLYYMVSWLRRKLTSLRLASSPSTAIAQHWTGLG